MPTIQSTNVRSHSLVQAREPSPENKETTAEVSQAEPSGFEYGKSGYDAEPSSTPSLNLPGARAVDTAEASSGLSLLGLQVKATYEFDGSATLSLGGGHVNPANAGADNGAEGSLGWILGNAHNKKDGEWLVSDDDVAQLKSAARPLLERVLRANGQEPSASAAISLPERFSDNLKNLEAERKAAGLPTLPDENYYPVQIQMAGGGNWEVAVHPSDLND